MEIIKNGSIPPSVGPVEWYTGAVRINSLCNRKDYDHTTGEYITYEPGARTAWHSHPQGQTLIIIAGHGLVQRWNSPIEEIGAGDVVKFAPGEKHWHGAAPDVSLAHIAIQEEKDGSHVKWMEPVSPEQYKK